MHEAINHYSNIGNSESSLPMQGEFGFGKSSYDHAGNVKLIWTEKELQRLNDFRKSTGKLQ